MNKRIKELAEQCRKEVEHFSSDTGFTYTEELDEEKFAELIVRECMDVVSSKCASATAYNALAEHFGVEE